MGKATHSQQIARLASEYREQIPTIIAKIREETGLTQSIPIFKQRKFKMIIDEHGQWLINFYKQREWYQNSPFIRLNFLMEEIGDLTQKERAIEMGLDHSSKITQTQTQPNEHLREELADVLDQVLILVINII